MSKKRRSTVIQKVDFWDTVEEEERADAVRQSQSVRKSLGLKNRPTHKSPKGAVGDATQILKKLQSAHRKKKERYEAEMAELKEAQSQIDGEDAALKERANSLQSKKKKQSEHKKELFKSEMELMEEVKVLAEKKAEIEEFKKAHKLMVRKLEQSIKTKSHQWATEMRSLVDEVNDRDSESGVSTEDSSSQPI